MRAFVVTAAVALAPLALAFADSYPLVAWSTDSSVSLKLTTAGMPSADNVADQLASTHGLCAHDSIYIIHYPGLHVSDLQLLSSSSSLSTAIAHAPASALVPHAVAPASRLAALSNNVSAQCGVPLAGRNPPSGKHVVHFTLKPLAAGTNAAARRAEVAASTEQLARELTGSYLAVLVGTRAPAPVAAGILHHYQLLTPGIITVLLISLGVLLPILLFGVGAITAIKSSLTSESFKPVTAQRKNQ